MAKLTKKDVLHVAHLSNLTLTDAEVDKFLPQLSKIVDFISQLEEVDTSDVDSYINVTGLVNVLRKDEVKATNILPVQKTLSGTENIHNNLFKVPAILSERTDK